MSDEGFQHYLKVLDGRYKPPNDRNLKEFSDAGIVQQGQGIVAEAVRMQLLLFYDGHVALRPPAIRGSDETLLYQAGQQAAVFTLGMCRVYRNLHGTSHVGEASSLNSWFSGV